MAEEPLKKRRTVRAKLTGPALTEALSRLSRCTEKLTKEQVDLLDGVFHHIVETHERAVRAMFRGLPLHEAEDLSQETFAHALTRLCNHGFVVELDKLLMRIAATLRYNHHRARRRSLFEYGLPSSSHERPESAGRPERSALLVAAYQRYRAGLPQAHLEVCVLMLEQQCSRREAAEILGIPAGTVQKRWVHVREELRGALFEAVPAEAARDAAERAAAEEEGE